MLLEEGARDKTIHTDQTRYAHTQNGGSTDCSSLETWPGQKAARKKVTEITKGRGRGGTEESAPLREGPSGLVRGAVGAGLAASGPSCSFLEIRDSRPIT
jgi:hypothetical protein